MEKVRTRDKTNIVRTLDREENFGDHYKTNLILFSSKVDLVIT